MTTSPGACHTTTKHKIRALTPSIPNSPSRRAGPSLSRTVFHLTLRHRVSGRHTVLPSTPWPSIVEVTGACTTKVSKSIRSRILSKVICHIIAVGREALRLLCVQLLRRSVTRCLRNCYEPWITAGVDTSLPAADLIRKIRRSTPLSFFSNLRHFVILLWLHLSCFWLSVQQRQRQEA